MNEGTGQASVATGEATATASVDTTPQTQSNVDTGQVATFSRESSTSNTADTADSSETEWWWAPGVKGEGPIPEGFNNKTFKYVQDAAKAHGELQSHHSKKLAGFTGAPEGDYELGLTEAASELGIELNSDDPNIAKFAEFAKSKNMNQETFTELLSMSQMANHQATQESAKAVINAVNENVDVQQVIKVLLSNAAKAKNMIKNLIDNFENHIDPKDPTNNCLDVAIITAPEKRTQKTKDKLKTVAGRVLNK